MFGRDSGTWRECGCIFTAEEILQQPATWRKTAAQMEALHTKLSAFIGDITTQDRYEILLTGAGTSEFVGNAACATLNERYGFNVRAVGTTDICAAPHKYLSPDRPTLMVSYARSGNSPESLGAVQAADTVCRHIRHVWITCSQEGALAKAAGTRDDCFCILLSSETNDRGFAMTSSFSNMYLATLLAFLPHTEAIYTQVSAAAEACEACFKNWGIFEKIVSEFDYDRIVFLGSAELKGIAQESALKTLELTAGRVAALFDTPLGFRHGPKSVVNDRTLTVIYLSDDPHTRRYEMDLLREMDRQKKKNRLLIIENMPDAGTAAMGNPIYSYHLGRTPVSSCILGLCYITAAQLLALFKSQTLGIAADNPCPTGEVNRVVTGVTIYPVEGAEHEC